MDKRKCLLFQFESHSTRNKEICAHLEKQQSMDLKWDNHTFASQADLF